MCCLDLLHHREYGSRLATKAVSCAAHKTPFGACSAALPIRHAACPTIGPSMASHLSESLASRSSCCARSSSSSGRWDLLDGNG